MLRGGKVFCKKHTGFSGCFLGEANNRSIFEVPVRSVIEEQLVPLLMSHAAWVGQICMVDDRLCTSVFVVIWGVGLFCFLVGGNLFYLG